MKHMSTLFVLALLCTAVTHAQSVDPAGSIAVPGPCFLATDEVTWTAIGLSGVQLDKVRSMQTACKTECAATPEAPQPDTRISGAVLKRYEEELRTILDKDQYAKWEKWCSERPGQM